MFGLSWSWRGCALVGVLVAGCSSSGAGGRGGSGGPHRFDCGGPTTVMTGCTAEGGWGTLQGPIHNEGGTLTVVDSIVRNTEALDEGGGMYNKGGAAIGNHGPLANLGWGRGGGGDGDGDQREIHAGHTRRADDI